MVWSIFSLFPGHLRARLPNCHKDCVWWTPVRWKAQFPVYLLWSFVCFKWGDFCTDMCVQGKYLIDLFKPSEIKQHQPRHDLVTRRDAMGQGVWLWREHDHVNQEPGESSACCWSWSHWDEDVSGLSYSFCRWRKQNQRFSRFDCVTADRGEPQAIGCTGYRELVADPTTNFRWTSTLHMSVMAGSLWNCPQDVQCLEISHWGSILGVMISESIWMEVFHLKINFRLCNWARKCNGATSVFWVLNN